ncbi:CidA/LrgA family protein [Vibrio hannami]|uniref:CidA/LrgA family protein n=1 Tax=Vibrio hannami TaxID=2717094 RepID=UPI00240F2786|nr:CidA/LrgA family protein [Vibrio hannami]MDG3088021.1 CidA/LrgA family protein [Vibrio hannami]
MNKIKLLTVARYVSSAFLILASLQAGTAIQHYFDLSIPGSIIGMLLLFSLMTAGIIPAQWVKPSAQLLIRYMILLFIPVSVGLMEHYEVLSENALQIFVSTVGGTAIVLVCLAWMLERILVGKK